MIFVQVICVPLRVGVLLHHHVYGGHNNWRPCGIRREKTLNIAKLPFEIRLVTAWVVQNQRIDIVILNAPFVSERRKALPSSHILSELW